MSEPPEPESEPEPEPEEPQPPGGTKRGALLLLVGGLLTGAGLFVFPGSTLETPGEASGRHGLPFWSLGLVLAAAGAWELALGRSPALAEAVRRRPMLPALLGLGLLGALAWWAYR